jgi:hypothetical protein
MAGHQETQTGKETPYKTTALSRDLSKEVLVPWQGCQGRVAGEAPSSMLQGTGRAGFSLSSPHMVVSRGSALNPWGLLCCSPQRQ